MIFVTALGIIIVLSGLLLVFAQSMRTEMLASANRLSSIQAEAVERGAEQWAMAQIDGGAGDAATITQTSADTLAVGNGYFWIIRPDVTQANTLAYGIADESGKLNLNSATPAMMMLLPGMTDEAADSIADWVDSDETARTNGAESTYYNSLPEPYSSKNSGIESPEELLLIKGVTPELLYGYDANHDGVIDTAESAAGGLASAFNSSGDAGSGFSPYMTVFSTRPATAAAAAGTVNISTPNANQLLNNLRTLLGKNSFTTARTNSILANVNLAMSRRPPNQVGQPVFTSLGAFYVASTMTADEFSGVFEQLTVTATSTIVPMNINTAASQALACLPGLDSTDVTTLISDRDSATTTGSTTSVAWAIKALTPIKGAGIVDYITSKSATYSADIVAISPDGRAFKRVKIVVDARQTPSKIIYRKDLTSVGWPLDEQIRSNLRAGQILAAGTSTLNTGLH